MLSLEDQIVVALRRTSHAIDVWSRQLLQQYGLTSPQLATLREIEAGQNVTNGALAIALHLSQPTVTGILNRLEQRGLIARVPLRIGSPHRPCRHHSRGKSAGGRLAPPVARPLLPAVGHAIRRTAPTDSRGVATGGRDDARSANRRRALPVPRLSNGRAWRALRAPSR